MTSPAPDARLALASVKAGEEDSIFCPITLQYKVIDNEKHI
jgi:hypothetical protein